MNRRRMPRFDRRRVGAGVRGSHHTYARCRRRSLLVAHRRTPAGASAARRARCGSASWVSKSRAVIAGCSISSFRNATYESGASAARDLSSTACMSWFSRSSPSTSPRSLPSSSQATVGRPYARSDSSGSSSVPPRSNGHSSNGAWASWSSSTTLPGGGTRWCQDSSVSRFRADWRFAG